MFNVRRRLNRMPTAARYGTLIAAVALAAGVLVPMTAAASPAKPTGLGGSGTPRLDHVFIIMLENHEADHVIGDPSAPYITSLAHQYGVATNYYGVTHTSEPNYIAATSGSTWWTNDDDGWYTGNHYPDPSIAGNHYPHTNIVTEMAARHIPWDAYMEAMPASGYLPDSWPATDPLYVSKHNPFILYNDVRFNPQWRDHIKPYQDMTADLNGPNPPRYVWISPDLCNDMHGGVTTAIKGFPETPCPYSNMAGDHNDELLKAKADAFVSRLHTIMSSRAWTGNSVIFVRPMSPTTTAPTRLTTTTCPRPGAATRRTCRPGIQRSTRSGRRPLRRWPRADDRVQPARAAPRHGFELGRPLLDAAPIEELRAGQPATPATRTMRIHSRRSSSGIADVDSAGAAADIGPGARICPRRGFGLPSIALASLIRTTSTSACLGAQPPVSLTEFIPVNVED